MNEGLLVLLDIDPGVMGLGSDSVGQLLLKADEEGWHPLHWLRSCHESKISLWQLGLELLQNTNSLPHLNVTNFCPDWVSFYFKTSTLCSGSRSFRAINKVKKFVICEAFFNCVAHLWGLSLQLRLPLAKFSWKPRPKKLRLNNRSNGSKQDLKK